jgi:hypothetical protein
VLDRSLNEIHASVKKSSRNCTDWVGFALESAPRPHENERRNARTQARRRLIGVSERHFGDTRYGAMYCGRRGGVRDRFA